MLRILALDAIYEGNIPKEKLQKRLRYTKPWHYYDEIFHEDFSCKILEQQYAEKLIALYEENPFALEGSNMRESCPYHDKLNAIGILYKKDGSLIDMQNGVLQGLIEVAANLKLDYREIISFTALRDQLKEMLSGNTREKRYAHFQKYLFVQKIEDHAHFPELNGQRGVFAKQDIPAGTVIGFYSGDAARIGDDMPPLLCSWPLATYDYKLSFLLARRFIQSYVEWTDGYTLGNAMKLVNSAAPMASSRRPVASKDAPSYGNTACYFGHFKTDDSHCYITIPFYITYKAVKKGGEIMTYYPL